MELAISASDVLKDAEKGSFYETAPHHDRSSLKWLQLDVKQILIPPRGETTFQYSVQVPKQLPLKGSYWAMILVEPVMKDGEAPVQKQQGYTIKSKIRYSYLIVLDIGVEEPRIKVLKKELKSEPNLQYAVDLKNTGGSMTFSKIMLDLYTPEGVFVRKIETLPRILLPNCSTQICQN
jgi:hypothetical protein